MEQKKSTYGFWRVCRSMLALVLSLALLTSALAIIGGADESDAAVRDFSGYSFEELQSELERVDAILLELRGRREAYAEHITRLTGRQHELRQELAELYYHLSHEPDLPEPEYPEYPEYPEQPTYEYPEQPAHEHPQYPEYPYDFDAGYFPVSGNAAYEPQADEPYTQEAHEAFGDYLEDYTYGGGLGYAMLSAFSSFSGLFTVTASASVEPPGQNPPETSTLQQDIADLEAELATVNAELETYTDSLNELDALIASYEAEREAIGAIEAFGEPFAPFFSGTIQWSINGRPHTDMPVPFTVDMWTSIAPTRNYTAHWPVTLTPGFSLQSVDRYASSTLFNGIAGSAAYQDSPSSISRVGAHYEIMLLPTAPTFWWATNRFVFNVDVVTLGTSNLDLNQQDGNNVTAFVGYNPVSFAGNALITNAMPSSSVAPLTLQLPDGAPFEFFGPGASNNGLTFTTGSIGAGGTLDNIPIRPIAGLAVGPHTATVQAWQGVVPLYNIPVPGQAPSAISRPGHGSFEVTFNVTTLPVEITKTATPGSVLVGDNIYYTLTVRNTSNTVTIPPDLVVVGDDIRLGLVSWNAGSLSVHRFNALDQPLGPIYPPPFSIDMDMTSSAVNPIGQLRVELPKIPPEYWFDITFSVKALPNAAAESGVINVAFIDNEDGTHSPTTLPVNTPVDPVPDLYQVRFRANPQIGGMINNSPVDYVRLVSGGNAVGAPLPVATPTDGWVHLLSYWDCSHTNDTQTFWTLNGNPISPAEIEAMLVTTDSNLIFVANFEHQPNVLFNVSQGGTLTEGALTGQTTVWRTRPSGTTVGSQPPTPVADPGWFFTRWTRDNPTPITEELIVLTGILPSHTNQNPLEFTAHFAPLPVIAKVAGHMVNNAFELVPDMSVQVGDTIAYRITVTNPGSVAIPAGTIVGDNLETSLIQWVNNSLRLVVGNALLLTFDDYTIGPNGQLRVTLPEIPGNGTAVITFEVTALPGAADHSFGDGTFGVPNYAFIHTPAGVTPSQIDVRVEAPEVSIIKTASPSPVEAGGTVTYTLVVRNEGNVPLTGLVVTDPLPPQLTNPSAPTFLPAGTGTGSFSGNTLTANLNSLAAGASVTITFTATVAAGTPDGTPVINRATVTDSEEDVTAYDTATIRVNSVRIDKSVATTLTDYRAAPGDTVVYTLRITNIGSTLLDDLRVTDPLPNMLTNPRQLNLPAGAGTGSGFSGTDNRMLTVYLPPLRPGESATISFSATVAANAPHNATIRNTATVSSRSRPVITDSDTETFRVHSPTTALRPTISKTANISNVQPGGWINYTITVRNPSTASLSNITVVDPIHHHHVNLVRGSVRLNGNPVSYTFTNGTLRVALGAMPANSTHTVTFQTSVSTSILRNTSIVNTAHLEGTGISPAPSASATVWVDRWWWYTGSVVSGHGGDRDGARPQTSPRPIVLPLRPGAPTHVGPGAAGGGTTTGTATRPSNLNPPTGGFANFVDRAVANVTGDNAPVMIPYILVMLASLVLLTASISDLVGIRRRRTASSGKKR